MNIKLTLILAGSIGFSPLFATPFFDSNPDTTLTPKYSFVNKEIDKRVVDICGDWGSEVNKKDIRDLINNNPEIIKKINSFAITNSHLVTNSQVVDAWTNNHAFTHVFCGEPTNKSLGGLHYAARFKEGEGTWLSMCGETELPESCLNSASESVEIEGVYTIPVKYKKPDGSWGNKYAATYNISMNADDILIEGMRAFLLFSPKLLEEKDGCILHIEKTTDYLKHKSVAAMTREGLVTFYSVGPQGEAYSKKKYGTKDKCK